MSEERQPEPESIRHGAAPPPPEAIPQGAAGSVATHHLDYLAARDLMTPGVVTIADDASLGSGIKALVTHHKHAILVVGSGDGRLLGWATDRGILAHLERDAPLTPIGNAITEDPVSVRPSATAREAAAVLSRAGTTHLLVASAGDRAPEGVISAFDLIRVVGT
jgi:CBS-domain-containing membrane protein